MGIDAEIILEPAPRNTAPALALAAPSTRERGDELMLVMPADHYFDDPEPFYRAVEAAAPLASAGNIITFGIRPTRPEAGYGYIKKGEQFSGSGFGVHRFIEKPDASRAAQMLEKGGYFWNSGIFLVSASVYLDELARFAPKIYEICREAWKKRKEDAKFIRPDADLFVSCPEDSIDQAVMEKTERAACCSWIVAGAIWDRGIPFSRLASPTRRAM